MAGRLWILAPKGLITPHFSWIEAACRHCGRIHSRESVERTAIWMERVREEVYQGRVVHVNSWCRCEVHNRAVGGATNSQHKLGTAVDHIARGLSVEEAYRECLKHQGEGKLIGGLGHYPSFVHADRGPARRWEGS